MKQDADVIVIGAGASGLAAAVAAAEAGASVHVLEKNHVPGRKILSTGSGKCNYSNSAVTAAAYNTADKAFVKAALDALPPEQVQAFFGRLGLLGVERESGRLFPRSLKAQDVVDVLVNRLEALNTPVRTLTEVKAIAAEQGGFALETVTVAPKWDKKAKAGETRVYRAARVVLASGSPVYPQIGGTSAGWDLLRSLGHTLSPPTPVIVPLKVKETLVRELDGVRLDAGLALKSGDKLLDKARGELLFTAYGVSGPAVLDLSRAAVFALRAAPVTLEIDLFPDLSAAALKRLLADRAVNFAGRPFRHFACGLLNEKAARAAAGRAGIQWETAAFGTDKLADVLKGFTLEVTGALGFEDAMVAAGGCACAEIEPGTFQSKKAPGLFVTGEILDVDGDSGGFNLHFAWTSGLLAGRAAAAK